MRIIIIKINLSILKFISKIHKMIYNHQKFYNINKKIIKKVLKNL